jgi:hypothetical protein
VRASILGPLLFAWVLTGCELYFGHDDDNTGDDIVVEPPDPDPNPQPEPAGTLAMVRCEDGALSRVRVDMYQPNQPGHGAGAVLGHCPGACRSAAYLCPNNDCTFAGKALCEAEPSQGATCSLDGASCSGIATTECPASTTCGLSLPGSSCACTGGAYHCTPHTPIATVQQKLVGKWRGMVDPPDFAAPYSVSLWIYPDGTYWAESPEQTAFYYGGDGPYPDRTIEILSASATEGAWANIGIFFGSSPPNVGAVSALVVTDTKLRFTFNASWFGCGQPFFFDLSRVQ